MDQPAHIAEIDRQDLLSASLLIVDDDTRSLALLESLLTRAGYSSVRVATTAVSAMAAIASQAPDLVVLDLHLPDVDGFALLEQMRSSTSHLLPIVVMTGDVTGGAKERAFALGASDYLRKPVDMADCLLRVHNHLHIRQLTLGLERHNHDLQRTVAQHEEVREAELMRRREIELRLTTVVEHDLMHMVFQPIVDIETGAIAGVEALARFDHEPYRTPDLWFADAWAVGRGAELELAAIELALAQLTDLPQPTYMSVNASPATLAGAELNEILAKHDSRRIVVELTEHDAVLEYAPLLAAIGRLREQGVRLAMDDTGTGFAGLQHLLRLRPDIIKLDRFLVAGIDRDPARRSLANALVAFSKDVGAVIVAEGVEEHPEAASLRNAGVRYGQGYHFARPGPLRATASVGAPAPVGAPASVGTPAAIGAFAGSPA